MKHGVMTISNGDASAWLASSGTSMRTASLLLFLAAMSASCVRPSPVPCTTCGDVCVDLQVDSAHCGSCDNACAPGSRCEAGACVATCAASQTLCAGACVDLQSNPAHCGVCGTVCAAGQRCSAGACVPSCGAGQSTCGAACFDLAADPAHCGTCDRACASGEFCSAGHCTNSCPAPLTVCNGASCVDTRTSASHCGACGTACASGLQCVAGQCKPTCGGTTSACGDACFDLHVDPSHCGECGVACAAGQFCAAGQCTNTCPLTVCGGACVDTQTSAAHCGACGTPCASGLQCVAGQCKPTCGGSTSACGDACFDLHVDPSHCGGCGVACAAGQFCAAGQCTNTCPLTVCGTSCVDPQQDNNHCGGCNQPCAAGTRCTGGTCVGTCPGAETVCGTACVDKQTDSANCGNCNTVCQAGTRCTAGQCQATCSGSATACGLACFDLQSDPAHCGGCATACAAGEFCAAGTCTSTCPLTACGTACVDPQRDPAHCGSCAKACATGEFCAAGTCTCTSASASTCPLTVCGAACVDPRNDPANCGACGNVCPVGNLCSKGTCVGVTIACGPGTLDCDNSAANGCETVGTSCFTLISVALDGGAGNGVSWNPTVDNSGRYVAFTSTSSNLVPNDTNGMVDLFLRDTVLGTTTRVSTLADGGQLTQDVVGGQISGDGRTIAFGSYEVVLPGDLNGGGYDVILVPLDGGAMSFGLRGLDGGQPRGNTEAFSGPLLSTDGRYVMNSTRATGLYPGDTAQGEGDIFVYDRATPTLKVASLTSSGAFVMSGANGYNAASYFISGNGRWVPYATMGYVVDSTSSPCADAYVKDMSTTPPATTRLRNDDGTSPLGCNGINDAQTAAGALVNNDGTAMFFGTRTHIPTATRTSTFDLYRRGAVSAGGPSTRLTLALDGGYPNGTSSTAQIDEQGSVLAFITTATDLLPTDPNGIAWDCLVWHGDGGVTRANEPVAQRVIVDGGLACQTANLSRNGTWMVLQANDALLPSDTNGTLDLYLRRTP